jgi:hypothetical protein
MKLRVRYGDITPKDFGEPNDGGWADLKLYAKPSATSAMTAGASILTTVRRAKLTPAALAWDFLTIALSAVVADTASHREASPDGWTRQISLDLTLADPESWRPHLPVLREALQFLTTDRWDLDATTSCPVPYVAPAKPETPVADCVALLSGGLDSLVGGIDLTRQGRSPYFVSHIVRGDGANQKRFVESIRSGSLHLPLNHAANVSNRVTEHERTQRARSLIFIAYGVLVASTVAPREDESVDLFVNENGYITINPPLTPMRVGSLSTRTAHPRFLGLLQQLFDAIGINVRLVNPYLHLTKGQMLDACLDQDVLKRLASDSTSCGKYARHKYTHCGRCVPCQVRRAAFLRWGHPDDTTYVYKDLGKPDADHAGSGDVRSVAIARLMVKESGLQQWLGATLASVPPQEREPVTAMLNDGLSELGRLHDHHGVT